MGSGALRWGVGTGSEGALVRPLPSEVWPAGVSASLLHLETIRLFAGIASEPPAAQDIVRNPAFFFPCCLSPLTAC